MRMLLSALCLYQVTPQLYSRGWVHPVSDPLHFFFWQCRESNPGLRICSQELWPLDTEAVSLSEAYRYCKGNALPPPLAFIFRPTNEGHVLTICSRSWCYIAMLTAVRTQYIIHLCPVSCLFLYLCGTLNGAHWRLALTLHVTCPC
jgi:hypothetical protein